MSELAFAPFARFAEVVMGQSPGADLCNTEERGLPFLQGCAEFGARHPHSDVYCSPPLRVAKAGSVLISVRAPVGTMNYADQDYCIGRGLGAFKAKPGVSNTVFLKHAVELNAAYLHRRSQGSTFAAVSTDDVKTVPIPVFKPEKQEKIATILTGIDTAIEKTEALIAKYQQIKAGLMNDLFTCGVLPNGQLRPPREQAPELYQETAIGWIPREWELKPLGELCDMTSGGTPSRSMPAYWGGSIPWVKTGEINYEDISRTEEYITPKGLSASSAKVFPAGTIVMAMYGEGVTRGRVAILAVPCASNQACIGFSFGNQIHIKYMYHFFEHCYEELRDLSNDGSQKNLSSGLLKQFQIRFPTSKAEQACIADRLSNLDQRIASEKKYLQNLCQQKLGLMHDLLTGKVPVKVEEAEVVDG